MAIIAIGETKIIGGKLMRKFPSVHACHGCAFESGRGCPNKGRGEYEGISIEDGGGECRGTIWVRERVPRSRERIRLIAAAQDLLEALDRIVKEFDHEIGPEHVDEYYPDARAAIAKARGTT